MNGCSLAYLSASLLAETQINEKLGVDILCKDILTLQYVCVEHLKETHTNILPCSWRSSGFAWLQAFFFPDLLLFSLMSVSPLGNQPTNQSFVGQIKNGNVFSGFIFDKKTAPYTQVKYEKCLKKYKNPPTYWWANSSKKSSLLPVFSCLSSNKMCWPDQ